MLVPLGAQVWTALLLWQLFSAVCQLNLLRASLINILTKTAESAGELPALGFHTANSCATELM